MNWFAAQQETTTCRSKRCHDVYLKLSLQENEFILTFQSLQEVAQKLQKPNNAVKA